MTDKTTGRISIGNWSDHKGIECKLKVTVLAGKTAGNSPVKNYAAQGGWYRYHEITNKRAQDVVNLIEEHPNIDLRKTALNLLKLEIDIEAFGNKYRSKGISHKKLGKRKKSQMQDLEDIIKEESDTLKEEYKKLSQIKDPTAKIWKIRTGVLGSKHKAPEPTCISHPTTGKLVVTPEEI